MLWAPWPLAAGDLAWRCSAVLRALMRKLWVWPPNSVRTWLLKWENVAKNLRVFFIDWRKEKSQVFDRIVPEKKKLSLDQIYPNQGCKALQDSWPWALHLLEEAHSNLWNLTTSAITTELSIFERWTDQVSESLLGIPFLLVMTRCAV